MLVRLNTTYTPEGKFLQYSELNVPDENGTATNIGYDSAVCLELFEPWVLETYNTSVGFPTSLRIVDKGPVILDHRAGKMPEINIGNIVTDPDAKRELNSTRLKAVYVNFQIALFCLLTSRD